MLYAVIDAQGEPIAQGLTEAEAAHTILTYDGAQYELRPDADGEGWILWVRRLNGNWTPSIFKSWEADFDAAEAKILAAVARAAYAAKGWTAEAIPQADFDAMQEGGEG